MSFPKYAEYAGTEAEWIPRIPAHWAFLPAKALFKDRNARALNSEQQLTASQKYGVIPQALFAELEQVRVMQVVTGRDILKQARKGDFVISMRSFQGGLEYCLYDGAVSSAYVPIYKVNSEVEHGYFKFLFKEATFIKALQQTSNLVRDGQALRFSNLTQVRLPLPSPGEQTQIARFLDHETAKIDALIAEQKRLIKLLQEKRQAVISHAVTKGLDPNVPMKDSGVEWLGEVPAHWDFRKISHSFENVGSGTTPPSNVAEWYDNGNIPWVTTGELRESIVLDTRKKVTNKALEEFSSLKVHPKGSLVVAMYGATIGRLGILGVDATVNQACAVLSGPTTINISFVYYWLLANRETIISLFASGGGQPNINQDTITSLRIPVPSTIEQNQITNHLDKVLGTYDELRHESQMVITTLLERRSALISAAVTGKIDVRDWKPPADESAFDGDVQKAGMEASA